MSQENHSCNLILKPSWIEQYNDENRKFKQVWRSNLINEEKKSKMQIMLEVSSSILSGIPDAFLQLPPLSCGHCCSNTVEK